MIRTTAPVSAVVSFLSLTSAFVSMSAQAGHAVEGRRAPFAFALVVNFQSAGAGINSEARDAYLNIVLKNLKEKRAIKVLERSWGREGEVTSCVQFQEWENVAETRQEISGALNGDPLTTLETVVECDAAALKP